MTVSYVGRNADEIAQYLARDLVRIGSRVNVGRVGNILEIRNLTYDILRPRERMISYKTLSQSKVWAYSEVMTEFLGLNPPMMESYTTNKDVLEFMRTFHRGDGRPNYTYGGRWHNNQSFQRIIKRMKQDRYTRQAVMNIYDSSIDLDPEEWNIPCTIIHQFMIRYDDLVGHDKLNLTVYMRSNDFFKGWKYDTFLNSFILEAFAGFMDCYVGTLTFFVGSFHVYERDIPKLEEFNAHERVGPSDYLLKQNAPIPFNMEFGALYEQLWEIKHLADVSRHINRDFSHEIYKLHPHFQDWAITYVNWNRVNLFGAQPLLLTQTVEIQETAT